MERKNVSTFARAIQIDNEKSTIRSMSRANSDELDSSKKTSWWWYEPNQNSLFCEFLNDTSLSGLKYVGQPHRHMSERIFWLIAFIVSVGCSGVLINSVYVKYRTSPVIIAFQDSEIKVFQIPFPAITVCNINNIQKSKFQEFLRLATDKSLSGSESQKYKTYVALTEHICNVASTSFSQEVGYYSRSVTEDFTAKKTKPVQIQTNKNTDEEEITIRIPQNESNDVDIEWNYLLGEDSEEEEGYYRRKKSDGSEFTRDLVASFFKNAAPTCEDMLLHCLWEGQVINNCSKTFRTVDTDFGVCCTFNMVPQSLLENYRNFSVDTSDILKIWHPKNLHMDSLLLPKATGPEAVYRNGNRRPRRIRRAGKRYGLSVLLNPDLNEYMCSAADSVGFQVMAHLPIEVPHVLHHGLSVEPGYETFFRIQTDVTTAESTLKDDFSAIDRNCFFSDERKLKFYAFYTVDNCIDECLSNLTLKRCGCVRYYMPREDTTRVCTDEKYDCTTHAISNANEFIGGGDTDDCECLATCTEIIYNSQPSQAPLRSDIDIWFNSKTNLSDSYAQKKVALLHIYLSEDSVYPRERKQLYGITDLIASTGGLLGLCLGFSVISILEIIYFGTLRAWFKLRFKRLQVRDKWQSLWKCMKRQQPTPKITQSISDTQLSHELKKLKHIETHNNLLITDFAGAYINEIQNQNRFYGRKN